MAIRDDYRQFTAKYRRIILEELRNPALPNKKSNADPTRAEKAPVNTPGDILGATIREPSYCEIDIQSAEKLSSGSLIFPLWKADEEGGWCIMLKSAKTDLNSCDEYEIVGRIQKAVNGPEFMFLVYKYLLNRKLDEKVLQSDWALIESRKITRRGVLKLFLESGDAGLGNRQFLLVPDPSPWLDQIEGALFQNETLPEHSI